VLMTQAASETWSASQNVVANVGDEHHQQSHCLYLHTTANHGGMRLYQILTDDFMSAASGKTVTVSGWMWCTGWPITLSSARITGVMRESGGVGDFDVYSNESSWTGAADAWKKFEFTLDMPTVPIARGALGLPYARVMIRSVSPQLTQWNQVRFALMKCEIGGERSRFEAPGIAADQMACHRYYNVGDNTNFRTGLFAHGVNSGTTYYQNVDFQMPMAFAPAITRTSVSNTNFPTTGTLAIGTDSFVENRVASATGHGIFKSTWVTTGGW